MGSLQDNDIMITFDGNDPSNSPVNLVFEYSDNGGLTYTAATTATGSPLSNPALRQSTPFFGGEFIGDSLSDGAGLMGSQSVTFRITVDCGSSLNSCALDFIVDHTPTCAIELPLMGSVQGNDIDIIFEGADPNNDPVDSVFEYSVNGGLTWLPATASSNALISNPDMGRARPFFLVNFIWNSFAGQVGRAASRPVDFRITMSDGVASGFCTVHFNVDNAPPPTVRITDFAGTGSQFRITSTGTNTWETFIDYSTDLVQGAMTWFPATLISNILQWGTNTTIFSNPANAETLFFRVRQQRMP